MALAVAAAIALALLFLRPAPPQETVVVLPGPDGKVGTVIVQRGETKQVLNEAYAASRSGETGKSAAIVRAPASIRMSSAVRQSSAIRRSV